MPDNPYNPLHPVEDPTLFFGREEALSFLQLNFSGRVMTKALVILGHRGLGKTSLLNHVPLVVDERYPSVYIDLSALEMDSPVALVAAIVDQTRAMMGMLQASTYRLPTFPDPADPSIDFLQWLADDYLDVVLAAIRRQRHMILMLDDAHLLFEAIESGSLPASLFGYFQGLLERYEQLDILAAMNIRYEAQSLEMAPFDDETLHHRLTPLSVPAAHQLMTEPVSDRYSFTAEALDRILELAGGHPFYLHAIGRLIYRRWSEARHLETITLYDVQTVYPMVLEMTAETIAPIWEALRPNERLVLTALLDLVDGDPEASEAITLEAVETWLSRTDYPLNDVQAAAAFRALEYQGIVHSDLHGYRIRSVIMADVLATMLDTGEIRKPPTRRIPVWAIFVAVLVMAGLVGGVLLLVGGDDADTAVDNGNRATVTLELDLAATQAAEQQTATHLAQPSPSPETSPTPTPLPIFRFGG